jgi:hypothetical protein
LGGVEARLFSGSFLVLEERAQEIESAGGDRVLLGGPAEEIGNFIAFAFRVEQF